MNVCKVRITASLLLASAAIAACCLWKRSHRTIDTAWVQGAGTHANVVSSQNTVRLNFGRARTSLSPIGYRNLPIGDEGSYSGWNQFGFGPLGPGYVIRVPHWFLIVVLSSLSALVRLPRFQWRFSVRTILIAITLVAVGLGLIVWLR